jgi:hypothetical protein
VLWHIGTIAVDLQCSYNRFYKASEPYVYQSRSLNLGIKSSGVAAGLAELSGVQKCSVMFYSNWLVW